MFKLCSTTTELPSGSVTVDRAFVGTGVISAPSIVLTRDKGATRSGPQGRVPRREWVYATSNNALSGTFSETLGKTIIAASKCSEKASAKLNGESTNQRQKRALRKSRFAVRRHANPAHKSIQETTVLLDGRQCGRGSQAKSLADDIRGKSPSDLEHFGSWRRPKGLAQALDVGVRHVWTWTYGSWGSQDRGDERKVRGPTVGPLRF